LQESSLSWDHLSERIPATLNVQPKGLNGIEMHDYQMHGLRWMLGLHDLGLNGILADDMGALPLHCGWYRPTQICTQE
jgi:SNF2 family DNA or RNA helicase